MRGVTFSIAVDRRYQKISIHTPHARRDINLNEYVVIRRKISIHTPHARRDTDRRIYCVGNCWFQSTRLMRGVTKKRTERLKPWLISIHTPHARRDFVEQYSLIFAYHFNPHASCEAWPITNSIIFVKRDFNPHASCEAWLRWEYRSKNWDYFNPHASCEAWHKKGTQSTYRKNFNPHASCEAWRSTFFKLKQGKNISIHTPHARRDLFT